MSDNLINSLNFEKSGVGHKESEVGYDIREAIESDIEGIVELCRNSILNSCNKDYKAAQLKAWAYTGLTRETVGRLFEKSKIYLTEDQKGLIGVASLSYGNYLHLLYVHPERQGCGYGKNLLRDVESIVYQHEYKFITVRASITAKPLFLKSGYHVLHELDSEIGTQSLINFEMMKVLGHLIDIDRKVLSG